VKVPAEVYLACVNAAEAYNLPLLLLLAIAYVESSFNPKALGDYDAFGKPHAFGLFQLHDRGAGAGYPTAVLFGPFANADIAARYLARAFELFEGNELEAIAAFNLGYAGVRRKGWEAARGYVEKVLAIEKQLQEEGIEIVGTIEDIPPRGCLALPLELFLSAGRRLWRLKL